MRKIRWIGAILLTIGVLVTALEGVNLSWQKQNLIPEGVAPAASGHNKSWFRLAEGAILMGGGVSLLLRGPSRR